MKKNLFKIILIALIGVITFSFTACKYRQDGSVIQDVAFEISYTNTSGEEVAITSTVMPSKSSILPSKAPGSSLTILTISSLDISSKSSTRLSKNVIPISPVSSTNVAGIMIVVLGSSNDSPQNSQVVSPSSSMLAVGCCTFPYQVKVVSFYS